MSVNNPDPLHIKNDKTWFYAISPSYFLIPFPHSCYQKVIYGFHYFSMNENLKLGHNKESLLCLYITENLG